MGLKMNALWQKGVTLECRLPAEADQTTQRET